MPKLKLLRYTTYFAGKKRKVDKYEIIHQIKDELKYGVPPGKLTCYTLKYIPYVCHY